MKAPRYLFNDRKAAYGALVGIIFAHFRSWHFGDIELRPS
jgi:hypothetical protein